VDGAWVYDNSKPVQKDAQGNINNVVELGRYIILYDNEEFFLLARTLFNSFSDPIFYAS